MSTDVDTDQRLAQQYHSYPELIRRFRVSAYTVGLARGTDDYERRLDDFIANLARSRKTNRLEVQELAQVLLDHPVLPIPELP
jgi:hypothetical protein